MDATQLSISADITKLINVVGLEFLVSVTSNNITYNYHSLDLPALNNGLATLSKNYTLLCSFKDIIQANESLLSVVRSKLPTSLEIKGLRQVDSSSSLAMVKFQGGSFSDTFATYRDQKWRVMKCSPIYNHIDKDLRLRQEIESISNLPQDAQNLYPQLITKHEDSTCICYEMEYIPYYNFATIVGSSEYDNSMLADCLESIYDKLFEVLYLPLEPTAITTNFDYITTIRRRLHEMVELLPQDNFMHRLLAAKQLLINDRMYPGLQETLEGAYNFLPRNNMAITYNHGDLILQDILLDPTSKDFRLVDSNGTSNGYMNDFAKTLLCTETYYDLLYEGKFKLVINNLDANTIHGRISYTDQRHLTNLDYMNQRFWSYLQLHSDDYFSGMQEWQKTLKILCGLQNIAIVMFHTLHHQKYQRATAFLLNGIETINNALI